MTVDETETSRRDGNKRVAGGDRRRTRRALLGAIGTAGIAGLAGCLGGGSDESAEEPTPVETIHPKLELDGVALTDVFPVQLVDAETENVVGELHWHGDNFSHWHYQPVEVPLNDWRNLRANFRNRDREPIPLGENEGHHLEVEASDDTADDLVAVEINGNLVTLEGLQTGTGKLIFHVRSAGERIWTSPLIEVEVTDNPG